MGTAIASAGLRLVYGGGTLGLMGLLADATLAAGGEVIGVIPRAFADEGRAHDELTEIRIVETMHNRKQTMADLADAFIALPGGPGTLDELFEQWAWFNHGMHKKPCGILNVNGYFDPLALMVDRMVHERFLPSEHARSLIVESNPSAMLSRLSMLEV